MKHSFKFKKVNVASAKRFFESLEARNLTPKFKEDHDGSIEISYETKAALCSEKSYENKTMLKTTSMIKNKAMEEMRTAMEEMQEHTEEDTKAFATKEEMNVAMVKAMTSVDSAMKSMEAAMVEAMDEMSESMMKRISESVESYAKSIFSEMDHYRSYMMEEIAYLEKRIRNHEKDHIPAIKGAGQMKKVIERLGLEEDYEVEKAKIYASKSNRFIVK